MDRKKTIVYIVCLGHSGSTLLGNILGSNSHGFHIGELVSPIVKGKPVICRNCLEEPCPVWGNIISKEMMLTVHQDYKLWNKRKWLRFLYNRSAGILYRNIFRNFTAKKFIVDSSKDLGWYNYNSLNSSFTHKFIFLKRDLGAVYAAYKRAYGTTLDKKLNTLLGGVKSLNEYYNNIEDRNKISLNYEEFVESPAEQSKRLIEFIGYEFEEKMLHFNEVEHHLIGGNHGLLIQKDHSKVNNIDYLIQYTTPRETVEFYKNLSGIQKDERWKTELSQNEKNRIIDGLKSINGFSF